MSAIGTRPVFEGIDTLLRVIDGLCHRQRFWYRARPDEDRGETPLPLLCLVYEPGAEGFLSTLSAKMDEGLAQEVPHILIDASEGVRATDPRGSGVDAIRPGGAPHLLPLLDRIRAGLNRRGYDGTRLTRFDRYRLADWLTRQHLRPVAQRDDRVGIIRLLRSWISKGRQQPEVDVDPGGSNFWLWVLVHIAPAFWFWMWRRRRETRWFIRQDYLTAHATNFLVFAERLTVGHRDSVSEEEVKKLLVHAFLEDLRIAYRRRLFPFRSRTWRRTAHTVVLLDNVSKDNGGWELLRLINDVRNETGDPDPLLVIAASTVPPQHSAESELKIVKPDRAAYALERWRQELPGRRQKKEGLARHLFIRLPTPLSGRSAEQLAAEDEYAWDRAEILAEKPTLLARQYVMTTLVTLTILSSTVMGGISAVPQLDSDCFPFGADVANIRTPRVAGFLPPDLAGIEVRPYWNGKAWECIGYSDSAWQVFGDDPSLRAAQLEIFKQNAIAMELNRKGPSRTLVSLVNFAGLTHPNRQGVATPDPAAVEQLQGMVMHQQKLNTSDTQRPLLRVIIANGADGMTASPMVVRDMLGQLFKQDSSLVGVIGMDRTTKKTQEAIYRLGRLGVPVIATTLTGSGLHKLSPLYFQIVPDNAQQAKLLRQYADHRKARRVVLYFPKNPPGDTYISTLVTELHSALQGILGLDVTWNNILDVEPYCEKQKDQAEDIAFYAGRQGDFPEFLREFASECTEDRLPEIIGGDAITRFIIDKKARTRSYLPAVPVSYVSLGGPIVLAGQDCIEKGTPAAGARTSELTSFCKAYRDLPNELRATANMTVPPERTGLAFDAAGLFLKAVEEHSKRSYEFSGPYSLPHPAAIGSELQELPTYNGVTGEISFTSYLRDEVDFVNSVAGKPELGRLRIANNKMLAIIRLDDITDSDQLPQCAYAIGSITETLKPDDIGCTSHD